MCEIEGRCIVCGGRLTGREERRCIKVGRRFEIDWACRCGAVVKMMAEDCTADHLTLLEMRSGHTPKPAR